MLHTRLMPWPPAAVFHYSRDHRGEHPQSHLATWAGILQGDADGGYGSRSLRLGLTPEYS